MKRFAEMKRLHDLEMQATRARQRLKISLMGTLLYRAPKGMWSDCDIVVEADGLGGATLLIVEGNYPLDYLVHKEQSFSSEEDACNAADDMAE